MFDKIHNCAGCNVYFLVFYGSIFAVMFSVIAYHRDHSTSPVWKNMMHVALVTWVIVLFE